MDNELSKDFGGGIRGLPSKRHVSSAAGKGASGAGILPSKSHVRADKGEPIVLAFLFDATGSREDTWIKAQIIQAKMIQEYTSKGTKVEVGVIVHRGEQVETIGWFTDGDLAKRKMQEINCVAGGTRISSGLAACLGHPQGKKPKAVVMVGDCCEEERSDIKMAAETLKAAGIPVHAFHEGDNSNGEKMYKLVADITKGAFVKFGPEMPLAQLIDPLFVHAVRGPEAFNTMVRTGHIGAKALEAGGITRALPPPS